MIIVSISGGKDSTAVLLKALEEYSKQEVLPIFADTKFEHPLTYKYLDYLERELGIKIVRVVNPKYPNGLIDVIREKKKIPTFRYRFCTELLKQKPIEQYLIENGILDGEMWIGIRANESVQRMRKYKNYSPDMTYNLRTLYPRYSKLLENIKVKFPILFWSKEQVFLYLKENGIKPNPIYNRGFDRVGCFPCIMSGKKEYSLCMLDNVGRKNIESLLRVSKEFKIYLTKKFDVYKIYNSYKCQTKIDDFRGSVQHRRV